MADKNDGNRTKHNGWIASLSNGDTVFEEPPILGERTSWGKLIERCEADKTLHVTQIQLQTSGRTIVGIKKADGYCAFIDYRAEGFLGNQDGPAKEERLIGIGSVLDNTVYCTLVNDQGQSWQASRPLASMRMHCILKPA